MTRSPSPWPLASRRLVPALCVLASTTVVACGPAREKLVTTYLPGVDDAGLVVASARESWIGEKHLRTTLRRVYVGRAPAADERDAFRFDVHLESDGPQGHVSGVYTTFYHADDEEQRSLGSTNPKGDYEAERATLSDLRAPVAAGTRWEGSYYTYIVTGADWERLPLNASAEIVGTGLTIDLAGGQLTGCVQVDYRGRGAVRARCDDGEVHDAVVTFEASYWLCPGLGAVKDHLREEGRLADGTQCATYRTEGVVTAIERPAR